MLTPEQGRRAGRRPARPARARRSRSRAGAAPSSALFDAFPRLAVRLIPLVMADARRRQRSLQAQARAPVPPDDGADRGRPRPRDQGDPGLAAPHRPGPDGPLGPAASSGRQAPCPPRTSPERPWIVPAAIGWLGRRMRRDWTVLELGSGRSTVWLGKRAGRVHRYEDNEFWVDRARELVAERGLQNVEIRRSAGHRVRWPELAALPDDEPRPGRRRLPRVARGRARGRRPRRHAPRCGRAATCCWTTRTGPATPRPTSCLARWKERRFAGVKDGWPEACETAIFRRPVEEAPPRSSQG